MFYKIIPHDSSKGKIFVPGGFSQILNGTKTECPVSAGSLKTFVDVFEDDNLDISEIIVSTDVVKHLHLPLDIEYQVISDAEGIRFGPVIGLLLARTKNQLISRKPDELLNYTLIYPGIKGLLYVFSIDGIDFKNRLINGFYYNPDVHKTNMMWEERTLPFSDSIFQRIVMADDIRLALKEMTSNRLFNSRYFDKWEFWKIVSRAECISENIPHTILLSTIDDLDEMLANYDEAYLKPLNGTLSRGLNKVSRFKGGYLFSIEHGSEQVKIRSKNRADTFLKELTGGRRYIIQQGLDPLTIDDRHMDFRVIMQKDHTKKWNCTGIIACIGIAGSICSNWGYELTFETALTKHFNFSQEALFKKRQEIVGICKKVCEALEMDGENYGDLGIDVLIDKKFKVWVLEANKRHYHTVPLWINDMQMFYNVKANPVKYAAALSGFDVY